MPSPDPNGFLLIAVGDCGPCMRHNVDQLPTHDLAGRRIVVLLSDLAEYRRLTQLKGRMIVYDVDGTVHHQLSARSVPRRYLLDGEFRVLRAETGNKAVDSAGGFK